MTNLKMQSSQIEEFWPKSAPSILNVPKYVEKYQNDKIVIKCGGAVLEDKHLFDNFIDDIVVLNKLKLSVIIIHGGGPRIKKGLERKQIQSIFKNGLRVTNLDTMQVVEDEMTKFNQEIVNALNLKSVKAAPCHLKQNTLFQVKQISPELGYVGKPTNINISIIENFLKDNLVPVIAPMGLDKEKNKYNINADTAAMSVAKEIKARRLLLMTNVEGVLDKQKKLIDELNPRQAKILIEKNVVQGGMIPKLLNCIESIENGVKGVVIIDGRRKHSILHEIFSDTGAGTLIRE